LLRMCCQGETPYEPFVYALCTGFEGFGLRKALLQ
jgi:hypothetical protein